MKKHFWGFISDNRIISISKISHFTDIKSEHDLDHIMNIWRFTSTF